MSRALTLGGLLAVGPFGWALGCSVYDDGLLSAEAPLGSAGSSGSAGAGATGATGGGSEAGTSGAGMSGGSTGGTGSGGSAGGSAGTEAGGSAGSEAGGGDAGGEGGAPVVEDATSIDDMEDDNAQIDVDDSGRNGFWYVGNDGTVGGTQEPLASAFAMAELPNGERSESRFSAHMKVAGYAGWGSVIGFNFIELLSAVKPYDASSYCGVSFWAKAAATSALTLRVPDGDTHPAGGVCVEGGAAGQACYDHFGKSLSIGTAWQKFQTKFSELSQSGSGYHPADKKLKPSQLFSVEWALPGANKAYEIWIDDVSFLACE